MDLIEYLGIKSIISSKDKVILSLNVTDKVQQPFGVLHGGINSVLAETAASIGANLNLSHGHTVGVNISTNHLKSVTSGKLTVEATPLRIGKKIQVWQANTFDDKNNLTSNSTITLTNIN
ncbi:PaaI family thioesterase [Ligilactobacillus salivarius]|uniref:Aromatic compound catabolic protein n=1 Tax=Ligilactobacillus salivarius TaxID=1624 RepID=A0A1V9RGD5_9LACO|nr:PaaI family thioesterase [Ligilactobacillus salivarius]OQQ92275.1 aromatic compound catabolic protein [Ligilactobacillus salivarius]